MFAFVFPTEMAAKPDIGPAVPGGIWVVGVLANTAFECVPRAFRVGRGGLGLAEEVTEVEEMLLAGAALGELGGLPFLNEFVWGHGAFAKAKAYEL